MSRIYEEFDAGYATACSDVTLCSNTKGFFKTLSDEMVALADCDDWITELEKLNDEGKLTAILENKTLMEPLNEILSRIEHVYRTKDAKISQERRKAAQMEMKGGNLNKAMALASQAVLRAPMSCQEEAVDDGISLALSLWVRAEILLSLKKPRAALEDLKLALKERLPAKMRAEYYWRMGHCYRDAGEPTRAKVSYELAGRLLRNDSMKSQLTRDIDNLDYSVQSIQKPSIAGITLTGGSKQNMPALSKLVKIVEEENKGRFAVANSTIRTGDVLLVDSPYAACLLPDYYGTHCLHCFERLENCEESAPIWCPTCSGVAFCSVNCRDTAVNSYHRYECQFLDLFKGSGMSILSHIALRMVTQLGLDRSLSIHAKYIHNKDKTVHGCVLNDIEGLAKKSKMKSRKERLNRTKKISKNIVEKYNKGEETNAKEDKINFEENIELKAAQIYSLCTHSDKRKGVDFLKRVLMSMFLVACLKKGEYFKKCDISMIYTAEKAISELILHNLQLLQFNAHEVYETLRGEHMFSGSKPIYIAVAIYPTGALFNHECYPAVCRYFEGKNIVLRTTRPLKPGDVISENYGPHFLMKNRQDRQRSLASRYWFRCECVACVEDWPLLKEMDNKTIPYLRCPNKSCLKKVPVNFKLSDKCSVCSTAFEDDWKKSSLDTIASINAGYQDAATLMENERPMEAIQKICESIDLFHTVAHVPHRETHIAQEALRSCFAASGKVHIVDEQKIINK